jgi:hypothetical protein
VTAPGTIWGRLNRESGVDVVVENRNDSWPVHPRLTTCLLHSVLCPRFLPSLPAGRALTKHGLVVSSGCEAAEVQRREIPSFVALGTAFYRNILAFFPFLPPIPPGSDNSGKRSDGHPKPSHNLRAYLLGRQ